MEVRGIEPRENCLQSRCLTDRRNPQKAQRVFRRPRKTRADPWSARRDSNARPQPPQACALFRLSYERMMSTKMAPSERFKRPPRTFEACCSIRLSYEGKWWEESVSIRRPRGLQPRALPAELPSRIGGPGTIRTCTPASQRRFSKPLECRYLTGPKYKRLYHVPIAKSTQYYPSRTSV